MKDQYKDRFTEAMLEWILECRREWRRTQGHVFAHRDIDTRAKKRILQDFGMGGVDERV